VVRRVQANAGYEEPDVRRVPAPPATGASPTSIVRGFLESAAGQENDPAVAEQYLAPRTKWDPRAGVIVYEPTDNAPTTAASPDRRTVTVALTQTAVIDPDGAYRPVTRPVRLTYGMTQVGGEWRVARVPSDVGFVLADTDVQRDYNAATVYRLSRKGDGLVPDRVMLPVGHAALPSALVRALLAGPTAWLDDATGAGVPARIDLIDSATLLDGVATVNLSRDLLSLQERDRSALIAQLTATLVALNSVERVRILVEGRPLVRTGDGTVGAEAIAGFDLDQRDPGPPYAVIRDEIIRMVEPQGGRSAQPDVIVAGAGVRSPLICSDGLIVALKPAAGASQVVAGVAGRLRARTQPGAFGSPSWARGIGALVPVHGGAPAAIVVRSDGAVATVPAPDLAALPAPLDQLQVSRDGARVLAVAGPTGARRLYLGRVGVTNGATRLRGWAQLTLPPGITDVLSVSWQDGLDVVVLARHRSSTSPGLWRLPLDGTAPSAVSTVGLPDDLRTLAAAPHAPVLVANDERVWREADDGGWVVLLDGTDPAYGC
jgi:hypothetical protein